MTNILAIPISPNNVIDQLYWHLSKDGNYSVRTGYWLGMGNPSRPATPQHDDDVWKKIWKLHWPPKLKHFLWRACKNSLPVNEICHYRHMAQSPACSRCDGGVENVCHALLDHQSNRTMWLTHPHYSIVQDAPRSSFVDTFRWLLSTLHLRNSPLSALPCGHVGCAGTR